MAAALSHRIFVFEATLAIEQNTLSVFNVIIETAQSSVSLIRYPFDFAEFHQKIQLYYPKSKIAFPTLSNPLKKSAYLKYCLFRDCLAWKMKRTNTTKLEKYLESCFKHPVISKSSILKDFTRIQREEDSWITSQCKPKIVLTNDELLSLKEKESQRVLANKQSALLQQSHVASSTNSYAECQIEDSVQNTSKQSIATIDDFHLLKVIGKGCMGKVFLGCSKSNNDLFAIKVMRKERIVEQKEILHIKAERDILVRLRNEAFIASIHSVFQTPSDLYFIMDYYAGGDLATRLSKLSAFSKEQTLFYAAEILQGLDILHQNGIIYRDLKPENVLIGQNGHIVLTDFGLSKLFSEEDLNDFVTPCTKTFCGTAEYLAPEVLLGEPYTYAVDFWSLGTLIYEMLAGTTPFWAETHMHMYKKVLENSLEFPSTFDAATKNLLEGLLQKNCLHRLGWGDGGISQIKSHPYFGSVNWDCVKQQELIPSFIPSIRHKSDTSNFDELFTRMPVEIKQLPRATNQIDDLPTCHPEQDPFGSFSFHWTSAKSEKTIENKPLGQTLTRKKGCISEATRLFRNKTIASNSDPIPSTLSSITQNGQLTDALPTTENRQSARGLSMFSVQNSLGDQTIRAERNSLHSPSSFNSSRVEVPPQLDSQCNVGSKKSDLSCINDMLSYLNFSEQRKVTEELPLPQSIYTE